jgi:hypothetical protein
MKLISMTNFVLQQHAESSNQNEFEDNCFNYANFLKQPLKLEMFVPCDEDGNVLGIIPFNEHKKGSNFEFMQHQIYKEAKEKVLFENLIYLKVSDKIHGFTNLECVNCFYIRENDNRNIENITGLNLKLTPNAINQIYKH